ncbi:MAG: MarR family transcriptional regulator [Bacillus sp. (in: firmicutes)]
MKATFNNELIRSFANINKAYYHLLKMDADRMDLTVVQLKALYRISYCPSISLGELAENLRLTKSTVSGVIDRLVQRDFVSRTTQVNDRRAINLQLTETGSSKLKELVEKDSIVAQRVKEVMELPEEDIQKMLDLNEKILTILNR